MTNRKLWSQDGKIVKDSSGKIIRCDTCACRPDTGYFMCVIEISRVPDRDIDKILNDPIVNWPEPDVSTEFICQPAYVESSYLIWPTMDIYLNDDGYNERKQPKVDMSKEVIFETYNRGESTDIYLSERHVRVWKVTELMTSYDDFVKLVFSKWAGGNPAFTPPKESISLWKEQNYGGIGNPRYLEAYLAWLRHWLALKKRDVTFSVSVKKLTNYVKVNILDDAYLVNAIDEDRQFKWIRDQNANFDDGTPNAGHTNRLFELDDVNAPAEAQTLSWKSYISESSSDAKYHLDSQWNVVFPVKSNITPNDFERYYDFGSIWCPVKSKWREADTGSDIILTFDPEDVKKAVHDKAPILSEHRRTMMEWAFTDDWSDGAEGSITLHKRSDEWAKSFTWVDYAKMSKDVQNAYSFFQPFFHKPVGKAKIECENGIVSAGTGKASCMIGVPGMARLESGSTDKLISTPYIGDFDINRTLESRLTSSYTRARRIGPNTEMIKIVMNRLPDTPSEALGIKVKRVMSWYFSDQSASYQPFPDDLYAYDGKMIYIDNIGFLFGKEYNLPAPIYEGNTKLIVLSEEFVPPSDDRDYGYYEFSTFPTDEASFGSTHYFTFCEYQYILPGDDDWTEEYLPSWHDIVKKGEKPPKPLGPPPKEIM